MRRWHVRRGNNKRIRIEQHLRKNLANATEVIANYPRLIDLGNYEDCLFGTCIKDGYLAHVNTFDPSVQMLLTRSANPC